MDNLHHKAQIQHGSDSCLMSSTIKKAALMNVPVYPGKLCIAADAERGVAAICRNAAV